MTGGRAKGRESRGYWYRTGRGWYVTHRGKSLPLCGPDGVHLKDATATKAREAYTIWAQSQRLAAQNALDPSVCDICGTYLESIKSGAANTYSMRQRYLFDLCFGVPFKYLKDPQQCPRSERIHAGFGTLRASEMTPATLEKWFATHPNWQSSRRLAAQAVRRAFNYAKQTKMIQETSLRGLVLPAVGRREAYWTQEEETAILRSLPEYIADALNACLRTGCRPGEMAALEARHVVEEGGRQRWNFGLKHKTGYRGKPRTVFVPNDIAEVVRKLVKLYPKGPLFRTARGAAWSGPAMKSVFFRLRAKLAPLGITLTEDQSCFYCARHTFAKRILGGEWGAPPQTIEVLAGLMGNSREVCWKHYAQWGPQYSEPLWRAIGG